MMNAFLLEVNRGRGPFPAPSFSTRVAIAAFILVVHAVGTGI